VEYPSPADAAYTDKALALAGERGVKALKVSFLLGGAADDPDCLTQLDKVFAVAKDHNLIVHIHTSPGAASDIDKIGLLVERYADETPIHLVHFGGGMSGHIKLIGGRFFDWIESGKKVYTDLTLAIGFTPNWLANEIDKRGIGGDRVLFATDQPWGDFEGEYHRMIDAAGGREIADLIFRQRASLRLNWWSTGPRQLGPAPASAPSEKLSALGYTHVVVRRDTPLGRRLEGHRHGRAVQLHCR
jgi:predicted TIM-barrel fold metal-dependent hydrolase